MKNILGLDLGTNSIGWSIVKSETDENGKEHLVGIEAAGSRIIPMDAAILGDFNKGNSVSQTAERTKLRGVRRLRERYLLRRDRLHRVLDILGFLPTHYAQQLDRYGKILKNHEPKLVWRKNAAGVYEFIFKDSFDEMLRIFKAQNPDHGDRKIPYDWTIYYLRKKALTEPISKEELAWILLNFNQKRGYYQLRSEEEEEETNKSVEFQALKVVNVEDSGDKKGKETWYNVRLENGLRYRRLSDVFLDWVGKVKEFVVTTELEPDGTPKRDKDGEIKYSLRVPKEDDWTLVKKRTESNIDASNKTTGAYIWDALLENPKQKIKGKLVRTIERKYYKEELKRILVKQSEYHLELQNRELYTACVNALYSHNEAHRNNILDKNFTYLFLEDILFYQRPLKSKKSLIDNCPYEERFAKDVKTGQVTNVPVKCIAKSNPLFQEFRLWQFISNLHIYRKDVIPETDVTSEFLKNEDDYTALYDWLNDRKDIDQKAFLKNPLWNLKKNAENYRWNYVEDKVYPCNEFRHVVLSRLSKCSVSANFLNKETEQALWHLLYSIEDKEELVKGLQKFAVKYNLGDAFVDVFQKVPAFKKEYGSYSAKAIKKLLPLMRMGKYWNENEINSDVKERISKITTGEYDEKIKDTVREKAKHFESISDFRGLPLWLACYVVYGRHAEAKEIVKWNSPEDIDSYLKSFRQHSLRNPIVEQVITETLRTVKDIWKQVGHIDEIHIELGREMKNPKDKRVKLTQQISENENRNLRIKYLLTEFLNPEFEIENVRPNSPSQQEILRIYEEDILNNTSELPEDIAGIMKKLVESDVKKRPSKSEVLRYKLWLEQRYRSPYTGQIIPLGKLFTPAYEIEHIIPQSRYFDDSYSNKVICESEVNKLKANLLAHEFIANHGGEVVELNYGQTVKIFSLEEYEEFVKERYQSNKTKLKKLMLDDIPDQFIARQLNDSRYISKIVKGLLSNIVREENEQEVTSKNVISCTGGVTDRLKQDWGINDIWNKIILPRFQRINGLLGRTDFTAFNTSGYEIPVMPLELQKGFNKKRIDHRHHAMDAIIIACASRNIVNYLSNESASAKAEVSRLDLRNMLCDKIKTDDAGNYKWLLRKPWESFTQDVYFTLKDIIVSFKQNLRVINKATNHYLHYDSEGKKIYLKQDKGDSWAIRKAMHKETVFGEVNLRKVKEVSLNVAIKNVQNIVVKDLKKKLKELLNSGADLKAIKKYFDGDKDVWSDINLSKIKIYYFTKDTNDRYFATRKPLDISFSQDKIREEVTDTGIQKILLNHLEAKGNHPNVAFSPEGIEEMNKNIVALNDGKQHQPILKVRVYEKAEKFSVGETGNKSSKYVEAAKGTNLFFAVYETEVLDKETGVYTKKRSFRTIPLNEAIMNSKQGLPVAGKDEHENEPIFVLSPNDLVYLPTKEELQNGKINEPMDRERIYKFVDSSDTTANFIPYYVANIIYALPKKLAEKFCNGSQLIQNELGLGSLQSKNQRALSGEMVKDTCIPIRIDRLGNIL